MLNFPPGGIEPEFQVPPVDVCVVASLLVHVTVPPTDTEIGLGAKAVVVIVDAPETIDTAAPGPDGVGEVIDGDEDDEQPKDNPSNRVASAIPRRIRSPLVTQQAQERGQLSCTLFPFLSQSIREEVAKDELRNVETIP